MGARASSDLFVSDMTLAELERGVLRLPPSRRQSELATWLAAVQAGYGQRALPFTRDTAGYPEFDTNRCKFLICLKWPP